MKKIILYFIAFAFLQIKAQTWQWATAIPVKANVYSSCLDLQGNTYMAVGTLGTVVIGGNTFGPAPYIVKFDQNGNIVWLKNVAASAICCDNSGNIFVTGIFQGTSVVGTYTLTSPHPGGIFTAKLDPSGNVLWAKAGTGPLHFGGDAVVADRFGNCFITGMYTYNMTFGPYTITSGNSGMFSGQCFIAKYDANGNCLWAQSAPTGNTAFSSGSSACVDTAGNCFITGSMNGTMAAALGTLTSNGGSDIFTAKYSPGGNLLWMKNFGGTGSEMGSSICSDPSGDIYVTGNFNSQTMVVGSNTLMSLVNQPATSPDIFLLKMSGQGSVLLAKNFGTTGNDQPTGLAANANYLYTVGGKWQGAMTVGSITITSPAATNYFIQFDHHLNVVSGDVYDGGALLSVDPYCSIYYSGRMSVPFVLGTHSLSPTGSMSTFMAKRTYGTPLNVSGNLTMCSNESTTLTVSGATTYSWSTGSSASSIVVTPTVSTTYAVWGSTPSSTCSSNAVIQVSVSNCVGIKENFSENGVSVFPNPAGNLVNIKFASPKGTKAELEIRNQVGQIVLGRREFESIQAIDISGFPKGIYFIRVNNYVQKFLKE